MSATILNPNNPAIAGNEYLGQRAVPISLGGAEARGLVFPSTATETIPELGLYLLPTSLGPTGHLLVAVDVYDADSVLHAAGDYVPAMTQPAGIAVIEPASPTITWLLKHSLGAGGDTIAWDDTAAYDFVDNQILQGADLSGADDLSAVWWQPTDLTPGRMLFHHSNSFVDQRDGSSVASVSGMRVGSVTVQALVYVAMFYPLQVWGVMHENISGLNFLTSWGWVQPGSWQVITRTFTVRPNDGFRFANSDIAEFYTSGDYKFGLQMKSGVPSSLTTTGTVMIGGLAITFGLVPERRVAEGYRIITSAVPGWRRVALDTPATGVIASWSKATAHNYLAVVTIPSGGGACSLGCVDAANVADHETDLYGTGFHGARIALDPALAGVPTVDVTGAIEQTWIPGFVCLPTGSVSVDGQPYAYGTDYPVDSTHTVRQRISTESTQAYQLATVLAKTTADGFGNAQQDAALTVTLKKTSDNSTVAGPVSIAAADVPADGKYHAITVRFASSASLTSGTSYYLELATASTVAWHTAAALAHIPGDTTGGDVTALAATLTAGGTSDYGTYAGTADTARDFPFSIGSTVTAPSGLASSARATVNPLDLAQSNMPQSLGYAHLTWTATSLSGLFGHYELQRQEDSVWSTIAYITTEANSYYDDVDGIRNVARSYRLRVVRADGAYSAWVSFSAVTVTLAANQIVLASGYAPERSMTVLLSDDPHSFKQLQNERGRIMPILGRDLPVAIFDTSSGGEQFSRRFVLAFGDDTSLSATELGHAVFEPLLALLNDRTLPTITYADPAGKLWYCSATVDDPSHTADAADYQVTVTFTQVAAIPTAHTIATPWSPAIS